MSCWLAFLHSYAPSARFAFALDDGRKADLHACSQESKGIAPRAEPTERCMAVLPGNHPTNIRIPYNRGAHVRFQGRSRVSGGRNEHGRKQF